MGSEYFFQYLLGLPGFKILVPPYSECNQQIILSKCRLNLKFKMSVKNLKVCSSDYVACLPERVDIFMLRSDSA